MSRALSTLAVAAAALLVLAAGAHAQPSPGRVMRAVTVPRMERHLEALQRIAFAHGGNRAVGTAGYAASVRYVAGQLRRFGYRVRVQPFSYVQSVLLASPLVEPVGGAALASGAIPNSAAADVTAAAVAVDVNLSGDRANTSGCEPGDFAGFPAGAIALVQRGSCTISTKVDHAAAAGAVAVLLFNQGDSPEREGLPDVAADGPTPIAVVGLPFAEGAQLAGAPAPVHVVSHTRLDRIRSSNVVTQTPARGRRVVALGAHLDSVPEGPGINDDGTGVAFLLELARQARRLHLRPQAALRFGFWGAEETGLHGSTAYVDALGRTQRARIAAYLNFDMLGSPNGVPYVYDGAGPRGSAGISRALRRWFRARRLPTRLTETGDRSDHAAFAAAGIPVGGLFSGAEEIKTERQWRDFGGVVGVANDPNYHTARDRLSNVDAPLLGRLARAGAFVATRLAQRG